MLVGKEGNHMSGFIASMNESMNEWPSRLEL